MLAIVRSAVGRSYRSLCLALAFCAAAVAAEPLAVLHLSADIVARNAAGLPTGPVERMYVANLNVRIETSNEPKGFFLIGESGAALFVRPDRQVFMDAKQSTLLTQFFVPIDPADPCVQWRMAAQNAGVPTGNASWRCESVAAAAVDGGGMLEYRVTSGSNLILCWVDSSLAFPVKLRAADGTTIALEHIRIAEQPATLFIMPPTYRKLDPLALVERIKHSDVWVGP